MDTERQRCCCPFVYSIMLISSLLVAKREVEIFPSIWIHLKAFFFSFSPKHLLFYSKYSTNYAPHPRAVEFIVYTLCLTLKQDAHFIRCLTWIRKIPIRSNGKNTLPHLTCLVLYGFFLPQKGDGMETIFACPILP